MTKRSPSGALLLAVAASAGGQEVTAPPAAPRPAAEAPLPAGPTDEQEPGEHGGVALLMRFGVTDAPFYSAELPEVKGHALVALLSGYARVGGDYAVGLRVPLSGASVAQPAGVYVDEAAWGNPELWAERRWSFSVGGGLRLRATGRFAVGTPLADRGPAGSLLENRALEIASALEGYREQELYLPGVLPLAASAQVELCSSRWAAVASVKLPLLIRVSDAGYSDRSTLHPLGTAPVLGLQGTAWVTPRFGISVAGHLVINAVPPVEPARAAGGSSVVQVVLAPALQVGLGAHVLLRVDVVAPVAGPLGGTTFAGGLHTEVRW